MLMNNASSQAQKKAEPMMILMPVVPCTRSSDFMHPFPRMQDYTQQPNRTFALGKACTARDGSRSEEAIARRRRRWPTSWASKPSSPRGGDVVGDGSSVEVVVGAD